MKVRVVFFIQLICLTMLAGAEERVPISRLEQVVAGLKGKPDAEAARQLSNLWLTERLSTRRRMSLEALLRGDMSRQALLVIADESAFLNPPSSEMPVSPAPSLAEQRRIMGLVVEYVTKTIPQLPNFFATRTTDRFEDLPSLAGKGQLSVPYKPMHFADRSQVTASYRDNREVDETVANGKKQASGPQQGLISTGEFGPILSTILLDASQNKLQWLRWEQTDGNTLAVFAYGVPRERSHFAIDYCCTADSEGRSRTLHELVEYTGQMAVDPATGIVLRLQINADLRPGEPIVNAAIAVEYAPVDIGGLSYICPVHSIALSRGQSVLKEKQEMLQTAAHGQAGYGLAPVVVGTTPELAEQTLLNDIHFAQYHVFRTEIRLIAGATDDSPAQDASAEPPDSPNPTGGLPGSVPISSAGIAGSEPPDLPAAKSLDASAPSATVESLPPSSRSETLPPAEIRVAAAAGLPDTPPSLPEGRENAVFQFRATSRLVNVSVVAFDKRGRPIVDLKPGDLAIYDNGRAQEIRYFTQTGAGSEQSSAVKPAVQDAASGQTAFSNSSSNPATGAIAHSQTQSNSSTIFLIDSGNIAFGDLTHARSEILRFLKTVPADEFVGLYVLKRYGFQILREPTLDHVQLAATLVAWMPTAPDLTRAQQEEQRNRQQMEYVAHVGDLLYLNGNNPGGVSEANTPVDPQLRALGDKPAHEALATLPGLARHLAMITGHKSLIWVSSDNVLADWSDKAPSNERGNQHIDPLALTAREALNEAHVSIYPLDASQLETGGVGADVKSANVELSPTANSQVQRGELPDSEKLEALEALERSSRNTNPGRLKGQLQQDTHPIASTFRELAEATGGRTLRRTGDIAAEINSIMEDGRAAYLLSFVPDTAPDDSYHRLTLRLTTRRDIALRYRTGYLYEKEPATLKERFQKAIWQPADISEIALSAIPSTDSKSSSIRITIATADLALTQQAGFWTDKLDVFVVQRDDASLHAKLNGRNQTLRLTPGTYQRILKEGLSVNVPIHSAPEGEALRIVVVDEVSGRMGTLTIPTLELRDKK
ncbi:MAG: VWA domain-containing protein [Terracidiphilus sp.]|nr:VWA domain-containing protein [Terracidiphilus sp.]